MKKTFIAITITHYNSDRLLPSVHYYKKEGYDPAINKWDLTVDEANKLMWELIKLGGKNNYRSNMYDNAISIREVVFWDYM